MLTDEQRMIRDMVREFAAAELLPRAAKTDAEARFEADVVQKLGQLNLFGLTAPADQGGAGVDFVSYAIALEEVGRVCGSTALLLAVHNSLGLSPLVRYASAPLRERWAGPAARGECIVAFAWTEADAGSDAGALAMRAEPRGGEWVLSGIKTAVACAAIANAFVVAARDPDDRIGLWLVDKQAAGVAAPVPAETLGMRAAGLGQLELRDVAVPSEARLVVPDVGLIEQLLDAARIALAAVAVGLAESALERALRYARERPQFVRAIVEHQSVQLRLADAAADTHAARVVVYDAARAWDAGVRVARLAATAKLVATEAAMRVADHAIQVHGGYGYVSEYHVERTYRDAKMCEIALGASDLQRFALVRELVRDADAGWSLLQ